MKQLYIKTATQSLVRTKKDLNSTQPHKLKLKVIKVAVPNHPSMGGAGGRLPKGPPGRSRSPGVGDELFPDHPPDDCSTPVRFRKPDRCEEEEEEQNEQKIIIFKTCKMEEHNLNTETQIFNKTQNSNFYKHLIFKIMKKQILFLAFFILAALAGMNKSYGQDPSNLPAVTACAPVTPLACSTGADALHPMPGQTYSYTVTVTPAVAAGGFVRWFVYNTTANADAIITGGSILTAAGLAEADGGGSQFLLDAENGVYNSITNTDPSIDISWQSFNGTTTEILLVAYVQANTANCADNIQVWRIEPSFSFTLDIASLMPDGTRNYGGTATNATECLTPVQSAIYNGTNLTMDYGENYVFFTVTAANFVHSWQPTFALTNNTQSSVAAATDITWAYPAQAILAAGTWNAVTAPVLAQAGSGAVGAGGECIVVRVHVDHNNIGENNATAARNIILGVDGIMRDANGGGYTTVSLSDLDNPAAAGACVVGSNDVARYDLTPRPAIVESNPGLGTFEPKN